MHLKDAINNQRYTEAENIKNQMQELKVMDIQRQLEELNAKHQQDRINLEEA